VSRRLRVTLIAGAIAAVVAQFVVRYVPGPPPPLIWTFTNVSVGLSFLVAGIAAWQRWPASRLGLLFTVVGYAWVLPDMDFLHYALPFTLGNLIASVYQSALSHLALAWPTGRLRSRFERRFVVAVYVWNIVQPLVSQLFWNPRTNGCGPGCPPNLLFVNGSNSIESSFDAWSVPVSLVLTAVTLTLIIRHWQVARGWSRRAMTPLLWMIHDSGLEHEPQLVRLTASAASLALEHSRLQAEVEAQLEQVRASRARIVEAGDAERRRLERDLHDGAQQRLVTLSLSLGMARGRAAGADPELKALIESASNEAREALIELRELARGIHPAVLTETGLAGAIQALAERSPVATTIAAVPDGRFPAAIEATAYFVVCEALANVAKHSAAGAAEVAIRRLPGRLLVQVSDDGAGGALPGGGSGLRGLADRVGSAGGVLRVDSPPGSGTRLEADIPCP
jgi:signal transduction histidine kinase